MPRVRPPSDGDHPHPTHNGTPGHEVLTLRETAALLRFSEEHTRRLAHTGHIHGWRAGRNWRFSRTALLHQLTHGPTQPTSTHKQPPSGGQSPTAPCDGQPTPDDNRGHP